MTRSHHICLGGDPPPAIKEQLVDVWWMVDESVVFGDNLQQFRQIPSGYLLHSHGKSPFLIGKPR